MPTEAKRETVAELREELASARTMIVSEYRGLTVKELAEIRRSLRKQDVTYRVVKNRLMRIAATDAVGEALSPLLVGPTAIAFGNDEAGTAKAVLDATRPYSKVVRITGGVLGDKAIDAASVTRLATLPSREVLLAKLAGGMQAPVATLAGLFAARGVPVIDADEIARRLTGPGEPAVDEIAATLGVDLIRDGTLDRRRLAARVFQNSADRQRLESILHPRIRAAMQEEIKRLTAPYCLLVIPLLIETGQRNLVDRVLVVDVDERTQIDRIRRRDARGDAEIHAILAAQVSRARRLQEADETVTNDGDTAALESQVEALHRKYLELAETS